MTLSSSNTANRWLAGAAPAVLALFAASVSRAQTAQPVLASGAAAESAVVQELVVTGLRGQPRTVASALTVDTALKQDSRGFS